MLFCELTLVVVMGVYMCLAGPGPTSLLTFATVLGVSTVTFTGSCLTVCSCGHMTFEISSTYYAGAHPVIKGCETSTSGVSSVMMLDLVLWWCL